LVIARRLIRALAVSFYGGEMSQSKSKNNIKPTLENKDLYKIALDTRNFEISLFWQRSNYFLALNSALALGFFNLKEQGLYGLVLAIFGIVVSCLWFRANLGSKFWQSRWEQRLSIIESQIDKELKFFSADWDTIKQEVEQSLLNNPRRGLFKRWLERRVLKKPSVSNQMILLSGCFFIGWMLLALLWCWRFASSHG
jgi:hypothetical protein